MFGKEITSRFWTLILLSIFLCLLWPWKIFFRHNKQTHAHTDTHKHTHTVVKRQCSLMLTSLRLYWHRLLKQLLRLFLRESAVAVATEAPLIFFPKREIVCVSKDAIFDARSLTVWEKSLANTEKREGLFFGKVRKIVHFIQVKIQHNHPRA